MERRAVSALLVVAVFGLSALALGAAHSAGGAARLSPAHAHGDPRIASAAPGAPSHEMLRGQPTPATVPALTVIWPNGTISGALAPINVSGNIYTLTADFTGGILDERNGSVLNGADHLLIVDPTLYQGVEVAWAWGVSVQNFSILNGSSGIVLTYADDAVVAHNTILSTYYGLDAEGSTNLSVWNNSALFAYTGFYFFQDSAITVRDNSAWGSLYEAIRVDSSSGATISNNQLNSSEYGFESDYSSNIIFQGNNASGSTSSGVEAYSSTQLTLSGNTVNGSVYGLYIEYSSYITSTGDWGDFAGSEGVYVYQTQHATFSGAHFESAFYVGLYAENSQFLSVTGSRFSGNTEQGIYASSVDHATINGNNLSGYYYEGVYLEVASNSVVSGNTIQGPLYPSGQAIYVYDGINISISDNKADQAPYGLDISASSNVIISGNDFSHTTGNHEAIYLNHGSNVRIMNNDLFNASYYGIEAITTSGLWIANNNVSYAGSYALDVEECTNASVIGNTADHAGDVSMYLDADPGILVQGNTAGFTSTFYGAAIEAWYLSDASVGQNALSNSYYGLEVLYDVGSQYWGNNASQSTVGMYSIYNSNSVFSGNTFWQDTNGFTVVGDHNVWIYHNGFLNDSGWTNGSSVQQIHWDNGYPGGGNFWSNHSGPDAQSGAAQNVAGADGIVDTPMVINASNIDHYPLALPWKTAYLGFVETGLDNGTLWSVTVGGKSWSSTTSSIWYPMDNAASSSYPYQVGSVAGYLPPSPGSGTAASSRTNLTINVVFSEQKFNLTFHESGLKNGTNWSVTVDGVIHGSNTTAIVVAVANGTHAYAVEIAPTGFQLVAGGLGSGNVNVTGTSLEVGTATFVVWPVPSGGGGASTTTTNGYTNSQFFGLLGVAVLLAILAVIGFALWMGARKPKPPTAAAAWTPPPATPPATPPPPATGGSPPSGSTPPPGAM